ncbi:hypothetical protein DUNSADRAFT_13900 [Dunaliella salina]|uniref:Encoded protein n=1 Tax=Dunaliella salina TaxID=3046 RepID=A0ABQ7G8H8_DUNSA|nr:hypothetical protein DUNSADRAFT_13900 [Dunaliella salina]|eukprot:KAF5830911.1 hypothetical protein DUNSADRAFT_13900 [Dunaliella salina]
MKSKNTPQSLPRCHPSGRWGPAPAASLHHPLRQRTCVQRPWRPSHHRHGLPPPLICCVGACPSRPPPPPAPHHYHPPKSACNCNHM